MLDSNYSSPPASQPSGAAGTSQAASAHVGFEAAVAAHVSNAAPTASWASKRALEEAEAAKDKLLDSNFSLRSVTASFEVADERDMFV